MAYHTYTEVSDTNQNKIEFNCLNWVGFSRNSLLGIITVLVLAVAGLGGALIYLTTKPDIKRCQNDTTAVQPPDLTDPIKPSLNERWKIPAKSMDLIKQNLNETWTIPPNYLNHNNYTHC